MCEWTNSYFRIRWMTILFQNVFCVAEVIERRDTYFLLVTPIIGLVLFFFKESPRGMEVGDVWRVKMLRRKDRQG